MLWALMLSLILKVRLLRDPLWERTWGRGDTLGDGDSLMRHLSTWGAVGNDLL